MPAAVVQGAGAPPAGGNPVFNLVSFPVPGNYLLALVGYNSTAYPAGKPAPPAGFTTWQLLNNSGANDALGLYYRKVVAGDGKSWTFTSGGDYESGYLLEVSGAPDPSLWLFLMGGGSQGANSVTTPALAPTTNQSLAIAAFSDDTGPALSTTSTGWTVHAEEGSYHGMSVAVLNAPTADSSKQSCVFDTNANFGAYTSVTILVPPATVPSTSFTLTATATDGTTSQNSSVTSTFTVQNAAPPPPALAVTTTSLGSASVGAAYSATLAATGGVPPYTWSVSSLPAGVTMSTSGVFGGTPTAAGSYSFTVTVTDSKGSTATASLSLTVSGAALATIAYPPGARYNFPALDSQIALKANTNKPYVDTDVWGPTSDETVSVNVYSARNWACKTKCTNPGGSVTAYVNTGMAYPVSLPWQSWAYCISGWDETMDTNTDIIASACYDNWFDNTLVGPTGSAINEVMLHFDFRNRGAGPWRALKVPFGGYTVNGTAIPLTYWNLAAIGTAAYWNLVDSSGNITNLAKGAVDFLAMAKWLVSNGYLSSTCNMTGFSAGYEICSTNGALRNFTYNNMWAYSG